MANWLEFKNKKDEPYFINFDTVIQIKRRLLGRGSTLLVGGLHTGIYVSESPEEIMKRLKSPNA